MRTIILVILTLSLLQASYIRYDDKKIVIDTSTNLVWQDDTTPTVMPWEFAIDYCETLTLGGYVDWHLPNKNELQSISDKTRVNPAINPVFKNTVSSYYWSSTTYTGSINNAWYEDFFLGDDYMNDKINFYYVRCVR